MNLISFSREASATPLVSVIIPAFNESHTLGKVIAAIVSESVTFELIVVDGNSSDGTIVIARARGARVISSVLRQRAYQLNLGARHARGAILLFLHADTILPKGALEEVVHALQMRNVVGGAFARRYASPSILLRTTCFFARWRNRLIGWHLGDQAMFVRSHLFFQLGGFPSAEMFEDLDFSRRLKRFGRIVTLSPWVMTSARRFERDGPLRTTWHDLRLTFRYLRNGLPVDDSVSEIKSAPRYHAAGLAR